MREEQVEEEETCSSSRNKRSSSRRSGRRRSSSTRRSWQYQYPATPRVAEPTTGAPLASRRTGAPAVGSVAGYLYCENLAWLSLCANPGGTCSPLRFPQCLAPPTSAAACSGSRGSGLHEAEAQQQQEQQLKEADQQQYQQLAAAAENEPPCFFFLPLHAAHQRRSPEHLVRSPRQENPTPNDGSATEANAAWKRTGTRCSQTPAHTVRLHFIIVGSTTRSGAASSRIRLWTRSGRSMYNLYMS